VRFCRNRGELLRTLRSCVAMRVRSSHGKLEWGKPSCKLQVYNILDGVLQMKLMTTFSQTQTTHSFITRLLESEICLRCDVDQYSYALVAPTGR